jgi:hypothetical protein
VDSGDLYHAGAFARLTDPRVLCWPTDETQEMRDRLCMQGWAINQCFRAGQVKGDLVCYLSDDDVYYPTAFAAFAQAATNPEQTAWYGTVRVQLVYRDGRTVARPDLTADVVRGSGGPPLRRYVDGMQACHRSGLDVRWPEERAVATEADGVFLDRLGALAPIHPIPEVVGIHRLTPDSAFHPS